MQTGVCQSGFTLYKISGDDWNQTVTLRILRYFSN